MPSQPAWFQRLDEIPALLWGFDTGYLDRQAPSDGDTRCGEVAGGGSSRNHHAWAWRAADRI